jgi:hypothetical protein
MCNFRTARNRRSQTSARYDRVTERMSTDQEESVNCRDTSASNRHRFEVI